MPIIASATGFDAEEFEVDQRPALTAGEAQALRERDPSVSAWQVLRWQGLTAVLVALATGGLTQSAEAAWSAAYGGLAVVLPAALFARGLLSRVALASPGAAVAAPKLVLGLSWPAMLVGLVVTMKVYWVALLVRPKKITKQVP